MALSLPRTRAHTQDRTISMAEGPRVGVRWTHRAGRTTPRAACTRPRRKRCAASYLPKTAASAWRASPGAACWAPPDRHCCCRRRRCCRWRRCCCCWRLRPPCCRATGAAGGSDSGHVRVQQQQGPEAAAGGGTYLGTRQRSTCLACLPARPAGSST